MPVWPRIWGIRRDSHLELDRGVLIRPDGFQVLFDSRNLPALRSIKFDIRRIYRLFASIVQSRGDIERLTGNRNQNRLLISATSAASRISGVYQNINCDAQREI